MVELKHEPENCFASQNQLSQVDSSALGDVGNIAEKRGARLVNGWAFPVGHQLWYVIDAPQSHIVADVFFEANAHKWNTVTINPVMDHDTFGREILGSVKHEVDSPMQSVAIG
jgi:hypothetical protein